MFEEDDNDDFLGNYKEEIEQFERYLNGENLGFIDSDSVEGVIDHYIVTSQYFKANKAADYGIYNFPYNAIFKLRKAQALVGIGGLGEALELISQVEKNLPGHPEVLLTKASIFSQLKDSKNAIKYLKMCIPLVDEIDVDEIYLDIAFEYQRLRNLKEAIATLKTALVVNPNNEGALYELAYCYDLSADYEQAIETYTTYIDDQPYSFTAWYNLGNAYSRVEKFDKAVQAYDYALIINPDFGPAHFNIANSYLMAEKYHQAIEHFHECVRLDGDDAMAFCYLGECHENLEETDLAKLFYRKAIEMAPKLPDAWLGLGIVLDMEGSTKEGITALHCALDLEYDNAGIHHVLAGAYQRILDFENAELYYLNAIELDPTDETCLEDYVDMHLQIEPLQALRKLQYVIGEYDVSLFAHVLELDVYWRLGDYISAQHILNYCRNQDETVAKRVFEVNPKLLNDTEFLLLWDN
ncbi:MAG: hypothetical protein RL264_2569 [Bacteroidota bacterium]|jgi:tetratricopeptide (TPR) repeat protein